MYGWSECSERLITDWNSEISRLIAPLILARLTISIPISFLIRTVFKIKLSFWAGGHLRAVGLSLTREIAFNFSCFNISNRCSRRCFSDAGARFCRFLLGCFKVKNYYNWAEDYCKNTKIRFGRFLNNFIVAVALFWVLIDSLQSVNRHACGFFLAWRVLDDIVKQHVTFSWAAGHVFYCRYVQKDHFGFTVFDKTKTSIIIPLC